MPSLMSLVVVDEERPGDWSELSALWALQYSDTEKDPTLTAEWQEEHRVHKSHVPLTARGSPEKVEEEDPRGNWLIQIGVKQK